MMRRIPGIIFAAGLVCLIGSSARADKIFTTDGEQISGSIQSVVDGKMNFKSPSMGDVSIPLTHIQTFSTDGPIIVQLSDGSQISSQIAAADAGKIDLMSEPGQSLSVQGIERINPQAFTASVSVGAILARGNTFTDTVNAGINLGYTVQKEQFTFTGEYLYGRTKTRNITGAAVTTTNTTTTDRWEVDGKYEHFFTKRIYGYADVDLVKDRIAQIAIRVVPSVGAGYQIFNKTPLKLGVEGGAAYVYQEYTNGSTTQSEPALKLAYHLTYDFTNNIQLFNDVTYYPVLAHISRGNFLLDSDIGLHAKLTEKLFAEFKIEWDYNAEPATGSLKNDERYIASLGYSL